MREQSSPYYVGLDVGTSMVRCVIGSLDPSSEEPAISVIGHGSALNSGVRKGLITHLDEVSNAVNQAVIEAERIAGVRVHNVTVNVNGTHVSGLDSKGVIAISAANREITLDDKLRAEEAATIVQIPSNREIIQVFPKNYSVDGHDTIKDPVGMRGVRLEVDTHIVTAATPNLKSLDTVLERVNLRATHHTVAGLAAAEAVLNRRQREAGTLVLDIGASTTNVSIIEDGEVQYVAVIPMGGVNVTNDLAIGLKVDLEIAESVKTKHAAVSSASKTGKVSVQHESRNHVFEAEEVTMIVEARIEEIFEYVDKELRKVQKARKLPGGVVLVGGTANIPGIAALAKDRLEIAARIGRVQSITGLTDGIQDVSYVTAVGLMQLDMLFAQHEFTEGRVATGSKSLLSGLGGLWQKFKG